MLEIYDEDVVFDTSAVFPDEEPGRGHQALIRHWKRLEEAWGGGMQLDPIELLDVGDSRYVLHCRISGKGTRSGIEVDQRFAFLHTFGPHGKIVHSDLFPDADSAIAAAEASAL